jgi:hypothetical protein
MSLWAARAALPTFCFSTSGSSVSALTMYTFTTIFLDSARMFLLMMMRVLSVVVVSVLLLRVELLGHVSCNHLVSLVLDGLEGGECRRFQRSAFHGELLRLVPRLHLCELVGDLVLDDEGTGVGCWHVFGVLLRLVSLLNLALLRNLLVNFVLDPSLIVLASDLTS